jgi:hypothetical protein
LAGVGHGVVDDVGWTLGTFVGVCVGVSARVAVDDGTVGVLSIMVTDEEGGEIGVGEMVGAGFLLVVRVVAVGRTTDVLVGASLAGSGTQAGDIQIRTNPKQVMSLFTIDYPAEIIY